MYRQTLVKQDCIAELQSMRTRIENALNRKVHYIDPDHTLEPTSKRNLWERYEDVCARIAREFPELTASIPVCKPPVDSEEPIVPADLKSLDRDVSELLDLLQADRNKPRSKS